MGKEFTDYEEAWQIASSGWGSFLAEAEKDLLSFLGDQWTPEWKAYLKEQGRSLTVYNKVKRTVKLISGYQRRNRLSMTTKPRGMSDGSLANQHGSI